MIYKICFKNGKEIEIVAKSADLKTNYGMDGLYHNEITFEEPSYTIPVAINMDEVTAVYGVPEEPKTLDDQIMRIYKEIFTLKHGPMLTDPEDREILTDIMIKFRRLKDKNEQKGDENL